MTACCSIYDHFELMVLGVRHVLFCSQIFPRALIVCHVFMPELICLCWNSCCN